MLLPFVPFGCHPSPGQIQVPFPSLLGTAELLQACPHCVPCHGPAMSPLLLTCSPLCRSPLPPRPSCIPQDASRRDHMPQPTALGAPGGCVPTVSPPSLLCPFCPCFFGGGRRGVPWSPSAPRNQRLLQSRRRWHRVPLFLGPRSEEGNRKSQTLKNSTQNAASLSLLSPLRKGGELRQRAPAGASGSPCPAVEMLGGQMGLCGEAVSPPAPRLQGIPQFGWGHCPWSPA